MSIDVISASPKTAFAKAGAFSIAIFAVVAFVVLGPAGRAAAADFGSTPVTGVTMTPTTIADAGTGRIDFTWVAPAGAAPGDTFSITLPDELEPASTRNIQLLDADTDEVALVGVWTGRTAVFTFQTYIATHTGVHGTAFFYVKWDQGSTGSGGGTFDDLEIAGHGLPTITKGAAGPVVQTRSADKGGGWTDQTQTAFRWFLALPGSTTAALAGPVSVTDAAPSDPGFTYDCGAAQLRRDLGGYPSPTNDTTFTAPAAGADVSGFTCSDATFTLTLDEIPAGTFYTLIVPVTITDLDRTTFSNTATFEWPSQNGVPQSEAAELRRDDAGGTVEADEPGLVCVGDYVWVDADKNGVQDAGESGIPGVVVQLLEVAADGTATVMTSAGTPMTATTDGSGLYRFCSLPLLVTGEKYRTAIDVDQAPLARYTPTGSGRGTPATDSSAVEGFADTAANLTIAGAADYTLDYGFVVTSEAPADSSEPPELADSGLTATTGPIAGAGAVLLAAGLMLVRRRRAESAR